MKKFLSCVALVAMLVMSVACRSALPASQEDMDRLGTRLACAIEQANANKVAAPIAVQPQSIAPAAPPTFYERVETVVKAKGEKLPDGSTADTTTKRLRVDGDLRFGANDMLLRESRTQVEHDPLVRISPPYWTQRVDTRQMMPAEVEKYRPKSEHVPAKEGRR